MAEQVGMVFNFDGKPLSDYATQFPERFQKLAWQAGSKARARAIEIVEGKHGDDFKAEKTGKLKKSIRAANRGSGAKAYAIVYTSETTEDGAPYPKYVHEGTGVFGVTKQPIRPKKAGGWLVFPVESGGVLAKKGKYAGRMVVFAKEVKGMPGRPFLTQAIEWVLTPEEMMPLMESTLR